MMSLLLLMTVALLLITVLGNTTIKVTRNVAGIATVAESLSFSDTEGIIANPSILPAQPASLQTRTSNTAGTLVMTNSNHGITTGSRIDLFWAGGQIYGATVGTVSGTSVPITGVSAGTNPANPVLPSQGTAITVGIPVSTPFNVTGNNIQALALSASVSGFIVFNNGSTDVFAAYLPAGSVYLWNNAAPVIANPLAGASPTLVYMSQTGLAAASTGLVAQTVTH